MPRMSGPALAHEVMASQPAIRTLFISGYTHEAIGRHGVLDPGVSFLQKPFSVAALLHAVRAVLDRGAVTDAGTERSAN
jgi:FixJ family two-component response regulator